MNIQIRIDIANKLISQHEQSLVKYGKMEQFIKYDCTVSAVKKKKKLKALKDKVEYSHRVISEMQELKAECE